MPNADFTPSFNPSDIDTNYGSTGGDITVPTFHELKPFRFWCQKALPLVYDDSLSYYELLCKVVDYLNNMMSDLTTATGSITEFAQQFVTNQQFLNDMAERLGKNTKALQTYINERMEDFTTAYTELQDYVNNYFTNLDVQEEINTKLDAMAQDGTLTTLLEPITEDWLEEKTAQITADLANQNQTLATQNNRISVLEGRMDTFSSLPSGSTSGNAELIDIRTNFLGETFAQAGDAVRASDFLSSGFVSLPLNLPHWSGMGDPYYTFNVERYKGGHIAMILNAGIRGNMPSADGYSSMFGSNVFPTEYNNMTSIHISDLIDVKSTVTIDYTDTSHNTDPVRELVTFEIPTDFPYNFITVEPALGTDISDSISPDIIVYGNNWDKTPVDPTLSVSGDAADAKVTGDNFSSLNNRLGNSSISISWSNDGWINWTNGELVNSTSFKSTDYITVEDYQTIKYYTNIAGNAGVAFYDGKYNYMSGYTDQDGLKERTIDVPTGAKYFRMACHVGSVNIDETKIITFIDIYKYLKNSIQNINSNIKTYGNSDYENYYSEIVDGSVFNTGGSSVDGSTFSHTRIFVHPKEEYLITGNQISTYFPLGIMKTDSGSVIAINAGSTGKHENYYIEIPTGVNELIVNGTDVIRPTTKKRISVTYPVQDYDWYTVNADVLDNIIANNGSVVEAGHHMAVNVQAGEHYKISGARWSDYVPSYVISNGTSIIAYEQGRTEQYFTDLEITIPANGKILYINGNAKEGLRCIRYGRLELSYKTKTLHGKSMVWYGTSIPQNATYFEGANWSIPTYVGKILGMNVINECYGASIAARGIYNHITENDPYGWTGTSWYAVFRSLGSNLTEKQDLIDNYETKWYPLLGGSEDPLYVGAKPQSLTDALKAEILSCSYENRLIPYLDGTKEMPDLFVFEHGYNDSQATVFSGISPNEQNLNRSLYSDAMYFFFQKIFEANPQAKILIVSHYDNTSATGIKTFTAQKELAEYHGLHFCDVANNVGWSQRLVKTTGYWDNGIWIPSGGTERTITRLAQCIPDQVHPHTDKSGNAIKREAQIIADFIAANVNLD